MLKNLKNTQFNFLFLGISAAMPSFALGIPFGLWLLSAGVSKQTLGLVTVSSIIVALNFFWSPFINRIKLPKELKNDKYLIDSLIIKMRYQKIDMK